MRFTNLLTEMARKNITQKQIAQEQDIYAIKYGLLYTI